MTGNIQKVLSIVDKILATIMFNTMKKVICEFIHGIIKERHIGENFKFLCN